MIKRSMDVTKISKLPWSEWKIAFSLDEGITHARKIIGGHWEFMGNGHKATAYADHAYTIPLAEVEKDNSGSATCDKWQYRTRIDHECYPV